MSNKTWPKRTGSVRQSSDIQFLDRGYPVATVGLNNHIGIIPSFNNTTRPNIEETPPGVLIFNTDSGCLELSCPETNDWVSFCFQAVDTELGYPTDGDWGDGALPINPSGTIADAIDTINEYLVTCCNNLTFASHLGTTDGNTNGFLIDPTFVLGRVSSPTTSGNPFKTNSWDNNTNRDLTNQSSLIWALGPSESITDLQGGDLELRIYDPDGLIHTENLVPDGTTNDQQSSPSGYLEISSLLNLGGNIEGFLEVSINVNDLLTSSGQSGYLRIEIDHTTASSGFYSNPNIEFFKDAGNAPSVSSQSASLVSSPVKYLSGVKFATIISGVYPIINIEGDFLDVWRTTYRSDPLVVQAVEYGIPNFTVPYNSSSVTKNAISPPISPFIFNEDFLYDEDRNVTLSGVLNPNANNDYANINFTIRDPFYITNGADFETNPVILINTVENQSKDNAEFFTDENYRLKTSSSGTLLMTSISGVGRGVDAWDSTDDLSVTPALQVINGRLVYPNTDFSLTDPSTNPDYSVLAGGVGDLVYIRRFRDINGAARTNGVLRIDGLSDADRLSKDILIELRVVGDHIVGNPTQGIGNEGTGWLSLNDAYSFALFKGDDGDGCFITSGGYSAPFFEFTLGTFSTGFAANDAIELRVTFKDPEALNDLITRIEIIDWV